MRIPILGPILEFLSELGGRWMDARLAQAEARAEIEKIKVRAAAEIDISALQREIQWDLTQVDASRTSWKDEFWTIILSVPVILAFIPGGEYYVEEGFRVLSNDVPEWYLYALGTAIAAAFGVRSLTNIIGGAATQRNRGTTDG